MVQINQISGKVDLRCHGGWRPHPDCRLSPMGAGYAAFGVLPSPTRSTVLMARSVKGEKGNLLNYSTCERADPARIN